MIQFSSQQKHAIELGARKRQSLQREVKKSVQLLTRDVREGEKQDSIIFGTTGIGKTWNVEKEIIDMGIPYHIIQGNISNFAFGANLMVLHHMLPKDTKMAIIVDDCDTFFENKENINILKGMTGKPGTRRFQYNRAIQPHLFSEFQMEIMPNYQTHGQVGFSVPTDDFVFIFTTNFKLPTEAEAEQAQIAKPGSAGANRKLDLAAVRGRMSTKDFMLDKETNWGWIAEIALNDNGLHMLKTIEQKMILLDWMYTNWDNMTEHNVRTIEKMAYEMVDYPEEYRDNWEADFLA